MEKKQQQVGEKKERVRAKKLRKEREKIGRSSLIGWFARSSGSAFVSHLRGIQGPPRGKEGILTNGLAAPLITDANYSGSVPTSLKLILLPSSALRSAATRFFLARF